MKLALFALLLPLAAFAEPDLFKKDLVTRQMDPVTFMAPTLRAMKDVREDLPTCLQIGFANRQAKQSSDATIEINNYLSGETNHPLNDTVIQYLREVMGLADLCRTGAPIDHAALNERLETLASKGEKLAAQLRAAVAKLNMEVPVKADKNLAACRSDLEKISKILAQGYLATSANAARPAGGNSDSATETNAR